MGLGFRSTFLWFLVLIDGYIMWVVGLGFDRCFWVLKIDLGSWFLGRLWVLKIGLGSWCLIGNGGK